MLTSATDLTQGLQEWAVAIAAETPPHVQFRKECQFSMVCLHSIVRTETSLFDFCFLFALFLFPTIFRNSSWTGHRTLATHDTRHQVSEAYATRCTHLAQCLQTLWSLCHDFAQMRWGYGLLWFHRQCLHREDPRDCHGLCIRKYPKCSYVRVFLWNTNTLVHAQMSVSLPVRSSVRPFVYFNLYS